MRLALLIALAAAAARADSNDVQLSKLGPPDGGGQPRFHRHASTLGLAFAPPFQDPAGTLGLHGFEIGVSASEALLRADSATSWAGESAAQPQVLTLPAVALRKGLGGSIELGAAMSWLSQSQVFAASGELRWAFFDGLHYLPDFALRLWGTHLFGDRELDLSMLGADLQLAKSFGVLGNFELTPYLHGGVQMIDAQTGPVDFGAGAGGRQAFHRIAFWENRYFRGAAGLRAVIGVLLLGVEGTFARGENPIQHAGSAIPSQTVQLWTVSGRLGLHF